METPREKPDRGAPLWSLHRASLQTRLTVLVVGLFLIFFLLAGLWVVTDARARVRSEVEASLEVATDMVEFALAGQTGLASVRAVVSAQAMRHLRIRLAPPAGEDLLLASPPSNDMGPGGSAPWWFERLVAPPVVIVALPRDPSQASEQGRVILETYPLDEVAESWREVRRLLLTLLGFSLAAAGAMAMVIRQALAPLKQLRRAVDEVAAGNFDVRVTDGETSPELSAVTQQFNRMAASLESARARNDELSRRALEIREAERRSLAVELHDHMGQALTAIRARAAALAGALPAQPQVAQEAEVIAEIAEEIYGSARSMIHQLRPAALDALGLGRALELMVDEWNGHHSESFCRYSWPEQLPVLPEQVAINLYRIAQEALTNVAKHADGATVDLKLSLSSNNTLRMLISDNGAGFDPNEVGGGLGLSGMRERSLASGGRFDLATGPGEGVAITVEVPVPDAKRA